MTNNKLFGIKSAYILLLALMVSALCLPAVVCAYAGEPVLEYEYSFYPVTAGTTGTANVRIAETGGYDYAANVVVALSTDTKGVSFGNPQTISKLGQGGSRVLTFPIYVDSSVKAGKYIGMLTISYDEYGALDIGTYHHSLTQHFQYTVEAPTQSKSGSGEGYSSYSETDGDNGVVILIIASIVIACLLFMYVAFFGRDKDRRERERREWERRNMGHPEWDRRHFR